MTKADLVTEISHKIGRSATQQTKLEIAQTVNALLDVIKDSVADGRIIYFG